MTSGPLRVQRHILALLMFVAWVHAGTAAPLDRETCDSLDAEYNRLEAAGAKADMQRGPEWAKSNLPAERLQRVVRFVELEQQLLFRCPSAAARAAEEELKKALEAKKEAEAAKEAAAKEAAAKEPPAAKAAQPAAAAGQKQAAKPAPPKPKAKAKEKGTGKADEPKAKPKTKQAKTPVNDAYSPGTSAQPEKQK